MVKFAAKVLLAILSAAIILAAGTLLFAYSGFYNVAASKEDGPLFHWLASKAMERSVRFHAEENPSPDFSDSTLLRHGAKHFKTMCVTCHGEPGAEPSEIGKGQNPKAPELSQADKEWSDSELHWIIRNGIKMTGMPAFGETHDEKEIWSLVAFIKAISGKDAEGYRRLVDSLEGSGHEKHTEPTEKRDEPRPWKKKSLF